MMKDKNILKVVFVIIGTMIGAGFASRARNVFIFLFLWNRGANRVINSNFYHRICNFSEHFKL